MPIAESKTEGPAEHITFLEIQIDTVKEELCLPEEKLYRLQREIGQWTKRRSCKKRDLLSLIGQLQHTCCVVRPGRTFLRRMINLSTKARRLHHNVRLNKSFKSLVVCISSNLEWGKHDVRCNQVESHSCGDIRCIRQLGLWSLHLHW